MKLEAGPIYGGPGETKERGSHCRSVGDDFNEQGNLPTRLVLGDAREVDLCTHPPES